MAYSIGQRAARALAIGSVVTALGACGAQDDTSPPEASEIASAVTGTALRDGTALYPRLVRLQHSGGANGRILASVALPPEGGQPGKGLIYESTDDGASFSFVGAIVDEKARRGLCCSTLFELPQAVGALPAGTLLWSASVGADGADRRMSMPVWKSNDNGRSWSYLSDCAASPNTGGLWEPEFSVASDGALVCHYSDETDGGRHSQRLMHARSYDGATFRDHSPTVETRAQPDRPGMAVVRRLPNGTYFMTYEICGPLGCDVYARTSPDGWNFGDPAALGFRPQAPDGKFFQHAPTIAWAPSAAGGGRILLVGQVLHNKDGSVAAGNGATILANTDGGTGAWYEVSAPVQVPGARDNFCPNYSSALLPSADGRSVLELATDFAGGPCTAFFARGSLQGTLDSGEIASGGTYRLVNVNSGLCLDVPGDTRDPATMQQWHCNDLAAQSFVVTRVGDGVFTLQGQDSGLCLDVDAGSRTAGTKVQQWYCNGQSPQRWRVQSVGNGYYKLVAEGSGMCLDVKGGSRAPLAQMQQWDCNDLAPQIWKLERQDTKIVSGATYRLVNAASGLCLDVPADARGPVQLQQWACNGLGPQNWVVTDAGNGAFTLRAQNSGLCLDVDADSRAAGGKVQQWACNGLGPQRWQLTMLADGRYTLKGQNSGKCLDVPGGTHDLGAKMQQWDCNNLPPQSWTLERR